LSTVGTKRKLGRVQEIRHCAMAPLANHGAKS
jgi:hypothetical protein